MAKVTFGPIVSEARNKVGGVVFSRNPHGAYSRTWLVPHNPNTTAQAAARLSMRELSQRWASALTDEQRAAWRSLGKLYPHIDVFRQKSIRPGLQTYLRSNLALASVGSGPLDDAPRKLSASDPQQITASAVSGAPPTITVNCDSPPAINEAVQIWVSRGLSTGRSYFYKYMRLVETFTAGAAGPWNPSAGWAARFTTLGFPSKLGIGVRYVNVETGATGPMRTALITATEGGFTLTRTIVDLSNAAVLALPTTPQLIVPSPGPGFALVHMATFLYYKFVATPTNIDPIAELRMITSDASAVVSNWLNPNFILTGPDSAMGQVGLPTQNGSDTVWKSHIDYFLLENLGISIAMFNNALGDLTGGDPGNALRVVVYSDIVPLT